MVDSCRRRVVAFTLGFAALASLAQKPERVPRVAFLMNGRDHGGWDVQFAALRKRGYVEGKTIAYLRLFANADVARLPSLAAELVPLKPDLVIAEGPPGIAAVRAHLPHVPILAVGGDPVASGHADSYSRPGRNLTGVVGFVSPGAKPIELLRLVAPGMKRLVLLHDGRPERVRELAEAARHLEIDLEPIVIDSDTAIERAFETIARNPPHAILVVAQAPEDPGRFVALSRQSRLPVMFSQPIFVSRGGLMSYGAAPLRPDQTVELVAAYVDKILKGTNAGELPIARTVEFELVINRKTAKAMGIALPPELLLRADRVID